MTPRVDLKARRKTTIWTSPTWLPYGAEWKSEDEAGLGYVLLDAVIKVQLHLAMKPTEMQQGSLHYTPEHCLVNGGFLFGAKSHVSNGQNLSLRSPVQMSLFLSPVFPASHSPPSPPVLRVNPTVDGRNPAPPTKPWNGLIPCKYQQTAVSHGL